MFLSEKKPAWFQWDEVGRFDLVIVCSCAIVQISGEGRHLRIMGTKNPARGRVGD